MSLNPVRVGTFADGSGRVMLLALQIAQSLSGMAYIIAEAWCCDSCASNIEGFYSRSIINIFRRFLSLFSLSSFLLKSAQHSIPKMLFQSLAVATAVASAIGYVNGQTPAGFQPGTNNSLGVRYNSTNVVPNVLLAESGMSSPPLKHQKATIPNNESQPSPPPQPSTSTKPSTARTWPCSSTSPSRPPASTPRAPQPPACKPAAQPASTGSKPT